MLQWVLKIIFGIGFIICSIVVILMYNKLSFIDWPYVIGGGLFLFLGLLLPTQKNRKH
ncbi:hypothetical protein N9H57_03665 [Flavobacteriaceae bacterium]|nr:hypothetical protein [Flavobacteriaceae bacterium]MDA9015946.1 hypothetical protein [Flavobacteriaceae bacterium]